MCFAYLATLLYKYRSTPALILQDVPTHHRVSIDNLSWYFNSTVIVNLLLKGSINDRPADLTFGSWGHPEASSWYRTRDVQHGKGTVLRRQTPHTISSAYVLRALR